MKKYAENMNCPPTSNFFIFFLLLQIRAAGGAPSETKCEMSELKNSGLSRYIIGSAWDLKI